MSGARDVLDGLAFVMHEQGYCGEVCVCVDDARALLPVVQVLMDDHAAAELEKAADGPGETSFVPRSRLRARAAALRAATGEGAA